MQIHTRITQLARARGLTAAEVARRAGLYPANVSAMDAGRRAVSLRMLARLARVLDCGPGELLESSDEPAKALWRQRTLRERLRARERNTPDGAERGWVHGALLAWQRHYRAVRGGHRA